MLYLFPQFFYFLNPNTEDKDVFITNLLSDLNIRTIPGPKDKPTIHDEFHA